MLADDHAAVDLDAGRDHHRPAVFQLPHRVGDALALVVGDENAVAAAGDLALPRRVFVEQAVHDRRALGVGKQLALVADQPARRRVEDDALAVAAGGAHLDHLGLALAHLLHDDAGMLLVDVDDDLLDRLEQGAVLGLLVDDLRARHAELEALAAHHLDEDRQLQLAAAGDDVAVGLGVVGDLQRDVALGLLHQAGADDAGGDLVALGAGERGIVDEERHRQRRRVDRLRLQRLAHGRLAQRVGDVEFLEPGDGDDVAGLGLLDRRALDAAEGEDLRHAALLDDLARAVEHLNGLVGLHRAGEDAAGDDAPEIGVGLEQRPQHAEAAFLDGRRGHVLDDEVEQRGHAVLRALRLVGHPALLGGAVEDREVELLVGGVERGEEVEHLVDDLGDAGVGLVDLVDRDDRLQADLQRLADHELGLRHRPLGGIDQHDGAVDHGEDALDLAAEIGVAGRVDDVDAGVVPGDGGGLRHDGDAALLLEVVRVHHALGDALVVAEGAGLLEEAVDEGRLAVIDVRDDRDVSQLHGLAGSE